MIDSANKVYCLLYLTMSNKDGLSPRINAQSITSADLPYPILDITAMQFQFPFIVNDSKAVCDICHFA
jgi:hypothetical protein